MKFARQNVRHNSMSETNEKNEFSWNQIFKISSCIRASSEERQMLRKLAYHTQCPRRQLLRRQPQVPGGRGGGGRRGQLRGPPPGEDGQGRVSRVEGDRTPGACTRYKPTTCLISVANIEYT